LDTAGLNQETYDLRRKDLLASIEKHEIFTLVHFHREVERLQGKRPPGKAVKIDLCTINFGNTTPMRPQLVVVTEKKKASPKIPPEGPCLKKPLEGPLLARPKLEGPLLRRSKQIEIKSS